MNSRNWLAGVIAAALLTGCGFHLRSALVLPSEFDSVYIDAPRAISDELAIFFEGADTEVAKQRVGAKAVLAVKDERYDRRVLSVDPNTGKEREFEITYQATFGLTDAGGEVLVAPQRVRIERDYVFDVDAVIGSSREEGILRTEMRRDAMQQILRRLNAALRG